MSGILGSTPAFDEPRPVPIAKPATMGEAFSASRTLARGDRMDAEAERLRRGYEPVLAEINADRGRRGLKPLVNPGHWTGDVDRRASADRGTFDVTSILEDKVDRRQQQAAIFAELRKIRAGNKDFLTGVPDDDRVFHEGLIQRERGARDQARGTLERSSGVGGTLASFAGGTVETMHDPVNLFSLPLGGGGRTIVSQIARSALVNGGLELIQQPQVALGREDLGEELTLGEAAQNVGFAAAGGVVGDVVIPQAGKLAFQGADAAYRRLKPGGYIASALRNADLPDDALASRFAELVPQDVRSFDEQAALHVITRESEVRGSSPYAPTPQALDVHAARLQSTIDQLLAAQPEVRGTQPVPRETSAAPIAVPSLGMQFRAILGIEGGIDRKGNFRTSSAGAIGPAQVMPGTAPEAARLAGVPFDDVKYRTDAAYNRLLGEAYHRDLLRQFDGDPVKAAAAYNAGPGSAKRGTGVRGALAKAAKAGEPDNWVKHLPAETRDYVRKFRERTGVEPGPGRAIDAEGELVVRPDAMDAERVAIGGPDRVEVDAPQLRFDLFPDEASHRIAQAAADAEALGIDPPVQSFRTAKGSVYQLEPGGTTTRDKMARPEHPGARERGEQPMSELTFYATKEDLNRLALMQAQGGKGRKAVVLDGDHAAIKYVSGPETGKIIPDTITPIQRGPAVGLHPVELWKGGERVHFGNEIVETAAVPLAKGEVEPGVAATLGGVREPGSPATVGAAAARDNIPPAIRDELPPTAAEDPRALDLFDDPAGDGAKGQVESLVHDFRAQLEAAPSDRAYRLEDGSERSATEILADLEEDAAALETIRSCL